MIALGSNVHIFARPHRREELAQCFETVLGSPVRIVQFPGIDLPMLVVSFPGGGHISIEFVDEAPDDERPAWAPGSSCAPTTRRRCCGPQSRQDSSGSSTRATRTTS